jgi:hypothetical protein
MSSAGVVQPCTREPLGLFAGWAGREDLGPPGVWQEPLWGVGIWGSAADSPPTFFGFFFLEPLTLLNVKNRVYS